MLQQATIETEQVAMGTRTLRDRQRDWIERGLHDAVSKGDMVKTAMWKRMQVKLEGGE